MALVTSTVTPADIGAMVARCRALARATPVPSGLDRGDIEGAALLALAGRLASYRPGAQGPWAWARPRVRGAIRDELRRHGRSLRSCRCAPPWSPLGPDTHAALGQWLDGLTVRERATVERLHLPCRDACHGHSAGHVSRSRQAIERGMTQAIVGAKAGGSWRPADAP